MPVASADVWKILYTVSRYLLPLLAVFLPVLILFYILSESRLRNGRVRGLPGSGTVGELIVLSGSRNLDVNTWFPVPREGILGSIRSCDLVIPCPGVHPKHLDFSWEDGTGLLIRPRTGCEVQINGIPVTCRTKAAEIPLTHGSVLQVGSALLRLHLFAALDNTVPPVYPGTAEMPSAVPPYSPETPPVQFCPPEIPDSFPVPLQSQEPGIPAQTGPVPPVQNPSPPPAAVTPSDQPDPRPVMSEEKGSGRLRRSDRWKEDLGE